jgi:hypothetical protein
MRQKLPATELECPTKQAQAEDGRPYIQFVPFLWIKLCSVCPGCVSVSLEKNVPFFALKKHCQSICALADSALPSSWILTNIVNQSAWTLPKLQDMQRGHERETLDQGIIQHHVTDCDDLSNETSMSIEYQCKRYVELNQMQLRRISHTLQNLAKQKFLWYTFSVPQSTSSVAFSLEFSVLNNIDHLQETSLGFSFYGVCIHLEHEPIFLADLIRAQFAQVLIKTNERM